MNRPLRSLSLLLVCMVLLSCFCLAAMAEPPIETERKASLTVGYYVENRAIPGAGVHVYDVARVDDLGHYTLTDAFSGCPFTPERPSAKQWQALTKILKNYADNVSPDFEGETDEAGLAHFTGLKTGLYLVVGQPAISDGFRYTMEPTLVSIPGNEEHQWIYDVTVLPKLARQIPLSSLRVIKEWADKGNESKRPESVTVRLLENGAVFDTAVLSKQNDWCFRWKDLPKEDDEGNVITWNVDEMPVEHYKVQVRQSGTDFIVTNTYDGPKPPNPPLPQTGQLWIPVYVLSFLGLCCIAIGAAIAHRRNSR